MFQEIFRLPPTPGPQPPSNLLLLFPVSCVLIRGKHSVFTTQGFPRAALILCYMTPDNQHSLGGDDAMRKCTVYKYYALLKHRMPFLTTSQVWKHLLAIPAIWQFEAGKSLELGSLTSLARPSLNKVK